jgi:signal transduction histidine kinase
MSTQAPEHHKGGQIAQKGFLYQNSIAAFHLFEMLICAERVWRVSTEVAEPVDDILVERLQGPADFYQVKCYEAYTDWTVQRLVSNKILEGFMNQFARCHGNCRLILSSPIPCTRIHALADLAREAPSLETFLKAIPPSLLSTTWQPLVGVIGSASDSYYLLRAYFEQPWPPDPQHIEDMCLGRYRRSPYATLPGLWNHLCDIAQRKALRGQSISRPDLIELLGPRFNLGTITQLEPPDISMARYAAEPAWYVHREEECKVLNAVHALLQGKPENVLVMGDGGTGKSSFFSWMRREFSEYKGLRVVDVSAEGGDPGSLLDSLNARLKYLLNTNGPHSGEVTSKTDLLRWCIREVGRTGDAVVIAVDHVESFFSSIFKESSSDKIAQAKYSIFGAIEQTVSCGNLMWVLFARSEYFFLMFPENESLRRLKLESWVRLAEFSDQQAQRLLDKLISISKLDLSDDAKRLFLQNSPRNPLKLVLAFINLAERLEGGLPVTGEAVLRIQPWTDVFQQDFNSLDETESSVAHAIASLMETSSRRFFRLEEIHENLSAGISEREVISKHSLADVLHRIQDTKRLLQQPVAGRYALYHENFAAYVISRYGGHVRTTESLRQFKDVMTIWTHQTRSSLLALKCLADRLSFLERSPGDVAKAEKRRKQVINDLIAAIELNSDQFRSAQFLAAGGKVHAEMARENISLWRIIRRVVEHFSVLARQRDLRISLELPPGDGPVVGDEGMLGTAFGNVIDNAIKYSFSKRVVRIVGREREDGYEIDVSNFGLGILPEEQAKIFDPFYRGSQTDPERFILGAGIGLHVVRNILEALGGQISAQSLHGGDTHWPPREGFLVTFTVTLPKPQ